MLPCYQAGSGVCLSKREILPYLLEGSSGSNAQSICDEEKDAMDHALRDISGMILSSTVYSISM